MHCRYLRQFQTDSSTPCDNSLATTPEGIDGVPSVVLPAQAAPTLRWVGVRGAVGNTPGWRTPHIRLRTDDSASPSTGPLSQRPS